MVTNIKKQKNENVCMKQMLFWLLGLSTTQSMVGFQLGETCSLLNTLSTMVSILPIVLQTDADLQWFNKEAAASPLSVSACDSYYYGRQVVLSCKWAFNNILVPSKEAVIHNNIIVIAF